MLARRLVPHALAYACYFTAVGALLPYLPAYLAARGFSGREVGLLLSFGPFCSVVIPIAVGYLADRSGRPELWMRGALLGTALALTLLPLAEGLLATAAIMLLWAVVNTPVLVLLDASTLAELAARGGVYARVRLVGSIAFVIVSLSTGVLLDVLVDAGAPRAEVLRWVPRVAAVAMLAQLVLSVGLPAASPASRRIAPADVAALVAVPGLVPLLGASMLHWVAMAPYHTLFAQHVHALGLPDRVAGVAMAVGASCEIVAMALAGRLEARFGARALLTSAFVASIVRWAACAYVTSAEALVLVQALHGLSFGAFYVAAVATLGRLVPPELRATGQGVLFAVVFGVGGGVGNLLTGAVVDGAGIPAAFLVASGASVLATLVWLRTGRAVA